MIMEKQNLRLENQDSEDQEVGFCLRSTGFCEIGHGEAEQFSGSKDGKTTKFQWGNRATVKFSRSDGKTEEFSRVYGEAEEFSDSYGEAAELYWR